MAEFDGEVRVKYTPATQPGEVTVVSVEDRVAAEAARDGAQAARDQAVAAEATFTAPADAVIAGLVTDGGTGTGLAVRALIDEAVPTQVEKYVEDFGAVGDGVADDTAAFAAAITAAGVGGKIIYTGVHKLGPITLLEFQTLETPYSQFIGTGPTPPARLYFPGLTGTQVGITAGVNNTFNNVLVWGPGYTGTCVGVKSPSGHPRFNNCGFYDWAVAVHLTGAYYSVFRNCEWSYSAVGVKLDSCYNVTVIAPRFNMANYALTTFGTAFLGAARSLNVYGGSIENHGAGGAIAPASGQAVNLFGVYFESSHAGSAAWGIKAESLNKVSVVMEGCFIYMFAHSRFVALSGSTNSTLVGRGNRFICATESPTTPIAYVLGTSPTTDVTLEGDDWSEVAKGSYIDNSSTFVAGGLSGVNVRYPGLYDATHGGRQYVGRHLVVDNAHTIRSGAAVTASRPAATSVLAGAMFYDTTLGKPIWSNGTAWRDAAGTAV